MHPIVFYIAAIILAFTAAAKVWYDHQYGGTPKWLAYPFIFGFGFIGGMLIAETFIKFG